MAGITAGNCQVTKYSTGSRPAVWAARIAFEEIGPISVNFAVTMIATAVSLLIPALIRIGYRVSMSSNPKPA